MLARQIFARSGALRAQLQTGKELVTDRSSAGVEVKESVCYRSHIPCPQGVNPLFHAKWAACYDLLSGHQRPFLVPEGERSYPTLANRSPVPLTAQLLLENFGETWREEVTLWFTEVYSKMFPEMAEGGLKLLLQAINRTALTAYSQTDLATGLAKGVPANIQEHMVAESLRAAVETYKELGEDTFKEKLAVEATRCGWTFETASKYLDAVKVNAAA